ncbi:GrpB family protein [Lysinibacillus sp. UGB7]
MRKTEIVPWTKNWEESYNQEAKILKEIFRNELLEIFHIGSTAVQCIGYAKPIIDILIVVKKIENVDVYADKMQSIGYVARAENGIAGRRYFPKGLDKRTHHVHIYQQGHENIEKHLNFKAYLFNNPDIAKEYGNLKIKLANQYPEDTHLYQKGKEDFVNQLVAQSLR